MFEKVELLQAENISGVEGTMAPVPGYHSTQPE